MKKQTINFSTSALYKAPKCKCVEVHVSSVLCGSQDGIENIEEGDVDDQTSDWGF